MWEQPELFTETIRTADDARRLLEAPGRPVRIVITRNRAVMISIRRAKDNVTEVRLVRGFLSAPDEIWHALRIFLSTHRRKAWRKVLSFVRCLETENSPPRKQRPTKIHTRGKVYDLKEIATEINRRYFSGRLQCTVSWGRAAPRQRGSTRSIRYGSYIRSNNTIRINPRLDDPRVPRKFLEYIVYHEMLHEAVRPEIKKGRYIVHTRNFKLLEKNFPEYDQMRKMCRELLDVLN